MVLYSVSQKLCPNGTGVFVFRLAVDCPHERLVQPFDQLLTISGDEVGKPFGLNQEPKSFDGVEVGRIRGEVEHLKTAPVQVFPFVPGGIVQDQNLPGSFENQIPIGVIQEFLKDFAIGVGELQKIGLARTGTDDPAHIHTDVLAVARDTDFLSLSRPASARTRIGLETTFVPEPDLDTLILQKQTQFFTELLPEIFILTVGPGARHLETEILFMEETDESRVTGLDMERVTQIPVELDPRPMRLVRLGRFVQEFLAVCDYFRRDFAWTPRTRLFEQSVYPRFIERYHPSAQGLFTDAEQLRDRSVGKSQDYGNNGAKTIVFPLRRGGFGRGFEFGQSRILGVGFDPWRRHVPNI